MKLQQVAFLARNSAGCRAIFASIWIFFVRYPLVLVVWVPSEAIASVSKLKGPKPQSCRCHFNPLLCVKFVSRCQKCLRTFKSLTFLEAFWPLMQQSKISLLWVLLEKNKCQPNLKTADEIMPSGWKIQVYPRTICIKCNMVFRANDLFVSPYRFRHWS